MGFRKLTTVEDYAQFITCDVIVFILSIVAMIVEKCKKVPLPLLPSNCLVDQLHHHSS